MKILFATKSPPEFLGGVSTLQRNLLRYIKESKKRLEITWVYPGKQNKIFFKDGIKYVEIRIFLPSVLMQVEYNIHLLKILNKNNFDVANIHFGGGFMQSYRRKNKQRIIHTYHDSNKDYVKIHMKRFGFIKRLLLYCFLYPYGILMEKPMKTTSGIICVSEKLKKIISESYRPNTPIVVVRNGVNTKEFKKVDKEKVRKELGLEKNKKYGLFIGRGGFWKKGLDRTINLSKKIYKKDKTYSLIIIGPDKEKVNRIIKEDFIIFKGILPREMIKKYYSASDVFFCLSRFEGGGPTLVVSEAMASKCLVICSKDSKQEIVKDNYNSIITSENLIDDSKKILEILNDSKKYKKITKNAYNDIKKIDIIPWAKKYLKELGVVD